MSQPWKGSPPLVPRGKKGTGDPKLVRHPRKKLKVYVLSKGVATRAVVSAHFLSSSCSRNMEPAFTQDTTLHSGVARKAAEAWHMLTH